MNPETNGNALHAESPESTAAVLEQHGLADSPETRLPSAETQTWATRADALKTSAASNKKPILLLGGGLAAAIALFGITTLVGKTPHKMAGPPQGGPVPAVAVDRPKGSVTPLMDTVHSPASSNTSGQLTPADINRTKATTATPMATPTTSTRPATVAGSSLASVPPFDSTQQHWEEPKPYGEPQTTQHSPQQQQNLLKEASLVFVRKAEPIAKSSAASGTSNDQSNVPQLTLTPGTRVQARLETQASTAVSAPVVAVVEYTYSLGNQVVIPARARVYGQLQQADRSGTVGIKFSEIELLDGDREKIEKIEAIGTSLELGPIKGTVTGKNTGKNFLVRTASGIGSVAAMLVGNNTSASFSEDDLIRERVAQNVGNAGDTEIMNMAVSNHIVVSVPADTPIYIVFTKRETGTPFARPSNNASQQ